MYFVFKRKPQNKKLLFYHTINSLKIMGLADPEITAVVQLAMVISCQEFAVRKDRQHN